MAFELAIWFELDFVGSILFCASKLRSAFCWSIERPGQFQALLENSSNGGLPIIVCY